jgi:predicted RNA binding protein YcfA (HicA-like mRNA interferase family)
MSRLTIIDAERMEKLLLHLGFFRSRKKGSHTAYRHPDGRGTTIPHHKGRDLTRPLIRDILSDINVGVEEYNETLKEI